jgi:phage-related protein
MEQEKEIRWMGTAYQDILEFPSESRKEAGFQLGKVQAGLDPDNWKPLDEVGLGTKEIRIREMTGSYRVLYVAKFEEAVYVLHCFQKKTEATTKHDKAIAETRYRAIIVERRHKK